jgi:hypothetical protein
MTTPPHGPVSGNPANPEYMHMVDLAESLLDEIAGPVPNWCRIAREARELARLAQGVCERS